MILDVCCGSKMFYFDKQDANVLFCDNRTLETNLCDGRELKINPQIVCDFRKLPFKNNSFDSVIFDPPHLSNLGESSWMAKKYGKLGVDWENDLKTGFDECMRVLKSGHTMVFKWNSTQHTASKLIKIFGKKPILGHKSGKASKTHWMLFYKEKK